MSFFYPKDEVFLIGPNRYIPPNKMTNEDLIQWMGAKIKGYWVEKRTGIQTRYWASEEQACSDLAYETAKDLLKSKEFDKEKISTILLSTVSGDFSSPPTAPLLQHRLGLNNCGSFDVGAACAGFITSLIVGSSMMQATDQDLLIISSEIRSKFLTPTDFQTNSLFGDGASSVIVSSKRENADFKLIAAEMLSDGSVADIISIPMGGSRNPFQANLSEKEFVENATLKMKQGAELFVKALNGMYESSLSLLERVGLSINDIDWVVPHQANLHMIDALARKLEVPMNKVVQTIKIWGNTSGASVGMALSYLQTSEDFPIQVGDKVLLISAGGGGLAANAILEVL